MEPPGWRAEAPAGGRHAEADRFWAAADLDRSAARSRARAALGLRLLQAVGAARGRLLDVGCGPGWALEVFRRAGLEVRGVDASPSAVGQAVDRGLPAEVVDIETERLPPGFQVVAALEVLEHLRDPLEALESMKRALAPSGRLLVSLPNELHLPKRLAILLGFPRAAGHRPFGGHDDPHLRHFTPGTAARLFREAGLEVVVRAWDGLAPPRWRLLRAPGRILAALRPQLFAIAGVFVLRPEGAP